MKIFAVAKAIPRARSVAKNKLTKEGLVTQSHVTSRLSSHHPYSLLYHRWSSLASLLPG